MPLFAPIDELAPADMPEPKLSFWQMVGPGAVLVGLSIGAGEIIIWPYNVAKHGAGMVWAAFVGVFMQLWINFEIGRWTVATGETVYTGFSRVWRGFAPIFFVLTILGWLAPGWAQASGSALKALLFGPEFAAGTFWGSLTCWTCLTFGIVALLLFGPKMIYHSVEKSIELLVVIVTVGLVMVAFSVGTADTWRELGAGIANVGHKPESLPIKQLFILLVFAGAGGTSNLFYTFYLRDKNIGMGALIPDLQNPLRGRTESIAATGFRFPETEENVRRFRKWFRFIRQDQMMFFLLLNTLTLMLFIYGALAVLRGQEKLPQDGRLIWDESLILASAWGMAGPIFGWLGRVVFLLVGVATLFSTQLALVDGVARSLSDLLHTNFAWARRQPLSWWYLWIAVIWMVLGCAITAVTEMREIKELGVLFNAAYMGGFAMALYVPLTLYMNLRYLPRAARPGPVCITMMILASLLYVGFAAGCLYWEIQAWVAKA